MTPVPLLRSPPTLSNRAFAGIRLTRPLCGFNLEQGNFYAAPTRKGGPMKTLAKIALLYAAASWALIEGISWLLGVV